MGFNIKLDEKNLKLFMERELERLGLFGSVDIVFKDIDNNVVKVHEVVLSSDGRHVDEFGEDKC